MRSGWTGLAAIVALWTSMGAAQSTGPSEEAYAWPLDLPRVITSSFAEPRSGRFHAGIDLRTGGIGPTVRAIADGEVTRVRCSPSGYGKAVYLTLDDGHAVVYAHLDDYAPEIREYVRAAQHAAQSYTVDLTPEPGRFRVKRGDAVAFAGATGSGPPHLHFEPRTGAGDPISPRLLGMTWPDATKPTISKLLVAPAAPGATVDGDLLPKAYATERAADGRYAGPTVRASGRIYVGVDVIDPANEGASRLGIRILRVVVDGEEAFRVQKDRLTYDTTGDGSVAWHPFMQGQGRFLLGWRWPGNRAPAYAVVEQDGALDVAGSPMALQIEAVDFHDNTTMLAFTVEPDEAPPVAPEGPETDSGRGTLEVDCEGLWLTATVRFTAPESQTPILQVNGADVTSASFLRIDDRTFRSAYQPGKQAGLVRLAAAHPRIASGPTVVGTFAQGVGGTVSFGEASVRVPSGAPYGRALVGVAPGEAPQSNALTPLTDAWRVWPARLPLAAPIELSFPAPKETADAAKVHLYRRSGARWSRVDTRREGGRLLARTSALGTFAAFADTTAPTITNLEPADGPVTSRRPRIRASVSDGGSGLADIIAMANDRWLLMAHDPEAGHVTWEADEDLPSGEVTLLLRVTDNAGNVREVTRTLRTP